MWMRTRCNLQFEMSDETPLILMLRPRSNMYQWIAGESYSCFPVVPVDEYTDIFGNLCQRMLVPSGSFSVHTSAEVMTADVLDADPAAGFMDIRYLPDEVLLYLLPSRYCESDRFGEMAREITAGVQLGYEQVSCIAQWVRNNISYVPESSPFPLSAVEVNQQGQGVCRDLAHIAIALCRSISIPTRLVVGFLHGLEPMDLHAWFEVYVGNRWYTFDPTQTSPRGGRLAIAYGRDAADVSVYHQFGPPAIYTGMEVSVELIDTPPH